MGFTVHTHTAYPAVCEAVCHTSRGSVWQRTGVLRVACGRACEPSFAPQGASSSIVLQKQHNAKTANC